MLKVPGRFRGLYKSTFVKTSDCFAPAASKGIFEVALTAESRGMEAMRAGLGWAGMLLAV